jgi:hypothetical protein
MDLDNCSKIITFEAFLTVCQILMQLGQEQKLAQTTNHHKQI